MLAFFSLVQDTFFDFVFEVIDVYLIDEIILGNHDFLVAERRGVLLLEKVVIYNIRAGLFHSSGNKIIIALIWLRVNLN